MGKSILLVEDYPVVQDLYAEALKKGGFSVDVVGDGGDALEKVKDQEYNFILLDLLLPETSGIEFMESFQKPKNTKVVVLSDFAYQRTVDKAYELGVDNYWMKSDNPPSQLAEKLVNYEGKDENPPEVRETGLA